MLNIIEPNDHQSYQPLVDSFLDLLTVYQNYSLALKELENATFIIASDKKRGVYGGAVILQQNISVLEKNISQTILTFQPDTKGVWTSIVGFYGEHHEGKVFRLKDFESCMDFYRDLLDAFIVFGKAEKLKYLYISLNVPEYIKMEKYSQWEYAVKTSHHEALDSLFHGILFLDPEKSRGIK